MQRRTNAWEDPDIFPEKTKTLAVIPVYNHARTLAGVVRKTLAVIPRVLVVDDGSTDAGAAVL
ncbi:MAG: glycosyltransferase, partial [Deltaproteobacteria bacterium]|nr:glycosyltransferase [Deltaproteobacteria bacterium]